MFINRLVSLTFLWQIPLHFIMSHFHLKFKYVWGFVSHEQTLGGSSDVPSFSFPPSPTEKQKTSGLDKENTSLIDVSEVVFFPCCLQTAFSAAFCAASLRGQRADTEPAPFSGAAPVFCAPGRAAAPASFVAACLCGCSRVEQWGALVLRTNGQ